jgi:site-specific DNA-methyltransferase (adenine-specific)
MDVSSTAAEHDVADNEQLHSLMIPHFYRILKPGGFCIMWADMMQWQRQYDLCLAAGFKVQRWPLIWSKTHPCLNQAAQYNFTKNYEIAIVCRKGNATLLNPQSSSIWQGSGMTEKDLFGHPFAKPVNLWKWLFAAVAIRGQRVLDPFAGSGSSTIAAIQTGLSPIGIELNEAHYNRLVTNVTNAYQAMHPNVKFQ